MWPPNRPRIDRFLKPGPKKGSKKRTPFLQRLRSKVRSKVKRRRWPLTFLGKLGLGR